MFKNTLRTFDAEILKYLKILKERSASAQRLDVLIKSVFVYPYGFLTTNSYPYSAKKVLKTDLECLAQHEQYNQTLLLLRRNQCVNNVKLNQLL